jgi:hypothetical protein
VRRLIVILSALGVAGCVGDGEPVRLPVRDAAVYVASVHPILEVRCGSLDCHGREGRPLRLYTRTGLRLAGLARTSDLSPAEVEDNIASLGAVDPDGMGLDNLNLTKPLIGRIAHVGGDIWLDPADPEVVCLSTWLDGSADSAACSAALSGLPPL